MKNKQNRICVLISTFNGSDFILDQIKSIESQKDLQISIVIRDDGSTDDTVEIIRSCHRDIKLYTGENLGYQKSFTSLLFHAPGGYDYYAFADQDDVWLENKLSVAINCLDKIEGPSCYCSEPIYVNEDLKKADGIYSNLDEIPCGYIKPQWAVSTGLVALGCTFVWNAQMQNIIMSSHEKMIPFAHDNFLSVLCPLTGTLYKDKNSYILYRQHAGNTSGEKKQKKYSFFRSLHQIENEKNSDNGFELRKFIWLNYRYYMSEEKREILKKSLTYRSDRNDFIWMMKENYASGLNQKEEIKYYWHLLSKTL